MSLWAVATNGSLTPGFEQCRTSSKRAKGLATILGDRDPAVELVDTVISAVQHDVTVLKFNGFAFVEPVIRLGTDFPGPAMIVTIQDMTVVGLRPPVR
jgi:hypothetical protein